MKTKALLVLSAALCCRAWGYVYTDNVATWQPGPIPFQIKLGTGTTLQDGTNHSTSVQAAMTEWNAQLGTVQFAPTIVGQSGDTDDDHEINEIVFSDTVEGDPYGPNVLAITLSFTYPSIHQRTSSDIFFNTAHTWNSYRGPVQDPEDIRRVALHELGHALGLGHPDQDNQSVTAIMNSQISNLDALAADDIAGAQGLYRAAGNTAPAPNNDFANATVITPASGTVTVTGTTYYATKQAGEPSHAGFAGGKSVWWKWTAPSSASVNLTTDGSHFDTLLGVYTGAAVNSLATVASNDEASGSFGYSALTFNATGGVTYFIAVDGYEADNGFVSLGLTFNGTVTGLPPATDFNGDGRGDIVWQNVSTGERSLWLMNGSQIAGGASLGTVPAAWTISGKGDFNGDGFGDLLWTNTATGDRAVWLMNGSTVLDNAFLGTIPVAWSMAGCGDFNGDGKTDIFWSNTATGDCAIWFMNGGAPSGGGFITTLAPAWQVRGTDDFNGDGKADVLWSNTSTGERAMWLMNGTTATSGASLGTLPLAWQFSATADFNGDGKSDIVLTNTTTGDRAMWLMNGTAIADNQFLGTVPPAWVMAASDDYDGNRKSDILWSNTSTGDRAMWLMNGTTVSGGGFLTTLSTNWHAVP